MFASLKNVYQHPGTSITGLLLGAVTVCTVLSQQGITLGTAGHGSVISLIVGVSTAILGLLARDPGAAASQPGSTAKLGAWALIALLLPLPFTAGCSGVTVAQDIVNWTPALTSAIAVIDSTGSILDPAAAPIFIAATVGFDAASTVLVAQAKAYLANPNATVLAQLQTAIVTLQQQVNVSLLQAGHIVNPASQQKALTDINAVATVVNTILALALSISSKAAAAQMASKAPVKLAAVKPYMDLPEAARTVAAHYNGNSPLADGSFGSGSLMVAGGEVNLASAGF